MNVNNTRETVFAVFKSVIMRMVMYDVHDKGSVCSDKCDSCLHYISGLIGRNLYDSRYAVNVRHAHTVALSSSSAVISCITLHAYEGQGTHTT